MLPLTDHARIAIIGAGPAGCFFAHALLKLANQQQRTLQVILFDGKNFSETGPAGCNRCAGVLSHSLLRTLESEGLLVPDARVQRRIAGYYLQLVDAGLDITPPPGRHRIATVFRGNGPRYCALQGMISFDDFLLTQIQNRGAKVIREQVREVRLPSDPSAPVLLRHGSRGNLSDFEADLVVGAFGVNSSMAQVFESLGFGYRPPHQRRLCQAELPMPTEHIQQRLQNRIFTFSLGLEGVRVAAWVPKSRHVTMTVIADQDATKEDLIRMLEHPGLRQWLPEGWKLPARICTCYPRIPLTAARQPYTDRVVLIGDACCARYFKNGIESAYFTAHLAAETVLQRGVSAQALHRGYGRTLQQTLVRDNRYGRLLFKLDSLISHHDIVRRVHLKIALWPATHHVPRHLHALLWNMATGDQPYRRIFWACLHTSLQFHLLMAAIQIGSEACTRFASGCLDRLRKHHVPRSE